MNDRATLPQLLVNQLDAHDQAKAGYQESRTKTLAMADRVDKHRQAANAARFEAEEATRQWRDRFRDADGELTKPIRQLKAKAAEHAELAGEYEQLADTLEADLEEVRFDNADRRTAYLGHYRAAREGWRRYRVDTLAEQVFGTEAGQALLAAIASHRALIEEQVAQDPVVGRSFGISAPTLAGQVEERQVTTHRYREWLEALVERHRQGEPKQDPLPESMRLIQRDRREGDAQKVHSPAYRHRRRVEREQARQRQRS
ncbi:hypothetical protein [Halotalea alkalilenta]|uniref:hypothetical protein n=1 Tax=Halotalea alkalilenta TaxID=376489 RepID=UPI00048A2B5B|nr:hypothetical protein [Halotalea alkalilenta]